MIAKIRRYLEDAATIQQLSRLNDKELDDIGVARGNIVQVVKTQRRNR